MARRNYRGKSQSALNFSNAITDEDLGFCKLLEKDGKDISLCGEKTRKRDFHYCRDCYSIIAEIFDIKATKTWPPKNDGSESRYCYDYKTENCFLIPSHWMEQYDVQQSDGSAAIDVKYRPHHSKKGGDYPCYVYVIRLKDNTIYVGQTKDLQLRLRQHKKSPGKTLQKPGGFKHKISDVQVSNRLLAEQLEQFLVNVFKDVSLNVTNGFDD